MFIKSLGRPISKYDFLSLFMEKMTRVVNIKISRPDIISFETIQALNLIVTTRLS